MYNRTLFEHITREEVTLAYFECRKHKRNKFESRLYESNYEENNYQLWKDLNDGTYKIGRSICFCVVYPKLREIFAASFRDRIVHHIIIRRLLIAFEENFIDNTYSCRKGKGVFFGVSDMEKQIKAAGKDAWFVKLDLSGFFMSIDKDILWKKLEALMDSRPDLFNGDLEWWKELTKLVVYNRCELNCEKRGDLNLWDALPFNKSLFHSGGKGIPIGNLTSQLFANFYLSEFDHFLKSQVQGYGRYVDDFVLIDTDKKKLLALIPKIREFLATLGLKLNEKKTVIQRCDRGVLFTGYVIKPWGIYNGTRLDRAARRLMYSYDVYKPARMLSRVNSYLGFMQRTLSYQTRYDLVDFFIGRYHNVYSQDKKFSLKVMQTEIKGVVTISKGRFKYRTQIKNDGTNILRWIIKENTQEDTYTVVEVIYKGKLTESILRGLIFSSIDKYVEYAIESYPIYVNNDPIYLKKSDVEYLDLLTPSDMFKYRSLDGTYKEYYVSDIKSALKNHYEYCLEEGNKRKDNFNVKNYL